MYANVQVKSDRSKSKLKFLDYKVVIRKDDYKKKSENLVEISVTSFYYLVQRTKNCKHWVQVFAASLADIDKALRKLDVKKPTDLKKILPAHYHEFLNVFDVKAADRISAHCESDIDMKIDLIDRDEKRNTANFSWDLLYSMSRDKLLVLQKTLTGLLDKEFIWISNSVAAVLVLFTKKPERELCFCVDYQELNKITRKD